MKIAVLGNGTVGSSLVKILSEMKIKDLDYCGVLVRRNIEGRTDLYYNIDEIVSDKEIDTVCECIGGVTDAYTYVKSLLESGKNVVTSNKALVVDKGSELIKTAKEKGVAFLFSAACGGGIPILRNLRKTACTDKVKSAFGILNGTCNYILTQMEEEDVTLENAIYQAQNLGYAEKDPTADISGLDTLRKVQLIDVVGFGKLPEAGGNCEGIEFISSEIIKLLRKEGKRIRLVGKTGENADGVYAYVVPRIVKDSDMLSSIKQNYNFFSLEAENVGRLCMSGMGAGGEPTASNMVRDLLSVSEGETDMADVPSVCSANNKVHSDFRLYKFERKNVINMQLMRNIDVCEMFRTVSEKRAEGEKIFFCEEPSDII